ncbi:Gfo/Idh/MocA family protein [Mangrovibrevibacter kandeliae]|uniref:Gfo/Idh/MocA family protein n=1 Tax=Mangrovibrevibacter kandeliae TaxID=2968473 RepID=UPI0021180820|nr:Gfo/Idh/MocA family oxidoreductase [Aurantimonas sp. CSK15Z-1]MCQ8783381.1 Gfo/Idh/MocA family oxidoreductase [Aurantimonas sp. CSK15Z-1]
MAPIRLGLVGVGKIARDQHFPSIAKTDGIELVAAASRSASVDGIENFTTLTEMLAGVELDAVALCTPPQVRHALAHAALAAGKHVLLEKPPGATVSELADLVSLAAQKRLTLFATWHSRFAAGVEPARRWLADRTVRAVRVEWKEDVRHWHPGQAWIWEPGGLGVFDPGINALSIVTRILPLPFFLTEGSLEFPENQQAPIAADLAFTDANGARIEAVFDWRQTGPQTWDIHVDTEDGRLTLSKGGSEMVVDGKPVMSEADSEYAGIYRRFVELVGEGRSDVDVAPLQHVADAFLLGARRIVEAFHDEPNGAA